MSLKIQGLKELEKKLGDLSRKAESIDGTNQVPVPELLTPTFLESCSNYRNADEFFEASGFEVNSEEDFAAIPDDQWDNFISRHTSFPDWQSMLGAAAKEWAKQKLGL